MSPSTSTCPSPSPTAPASARPTSGRVPLQGRCTARPATVSCQPLPAILTRSQALASPALRLRPFDPLNRRGEDSLTRRGWKPQPAEGPLPHPYPWAHTMARVIIEVLYGTRPAEQLARWLAPELYVALRERERLTPAPTTRAPQRVRTRCVRIQVAQSTATFVALECIGVVDIGERTRALALRVESYRSRWRITALEVG